MNSLFFYGTLCHRPLLDLVLGGESTCRISPAILPGHVANWVQNQPFPMISEREASAQLSGLLVQDLSDQDVARLNFYEGGFDYSLQEVMVQVEPEGTQVQTQVYFPTPGLWTPGAVWNLRDWEQQFGAMTVEAAKEVMEGFGHVSPDEIARRFPMIRTRASSRVRARSEPAPTTLRADYGVQDVAVTRRGRPYTKFFTLEEQELSFRKYSGRDERGRRPCRLCRRGCCDRAAL